MDTTPIITLEDVPAGREDQEVVRAFDTATARTSVAALLETVC
jgi:hypothetical protein